MQIPGISKYKLCTDWFLVKKYCRYVGFRDLHR
jgi:hypothetical protein